MSYPHTQRMTMAVPPPMSLEKPYIPHAQYHRNFDKPFSPPPQYENKRFSQQQQQHDYYTTSAPFSPYDYKQPIRASWQAGPIYPQEDYMVKHQQLLQQQQQQHPPQATPTRTSTIEPDPLPPHSNPQALSPTQSSAFEGPAPIPAVRMSKDVVTDARSDAVLFAIFREAKHMPSFLSTKPLLTVTRATNATRIGAIRFKTLDNSACDIEVNGQTTRLAKDGFMRFRWCFRSTSGGGGGGGGGRGAVETWCIRKHKLDVVLEDAKKGGQVVARLKGNTLSFEKGGLSQATIDETVMAFLALAEAARRAGKVKEIGELTGAIGDLGTSDGGGGGGG